MKNLQKQRLLIQEYNIANVCYNDSNIIAFCRKFLKLINTSRLKKPIINRNNFFSILFDFVDISSAVIYGMMI